MATQAYDAVIATITVANDATSVTKAMVKSTTWREGTSGSWLSTDCTLTAGKVYQFRTPLSGMGSGTTAILPNIKADVTVDWDTSGSVITNAGTYFMYYYARGCSSLTSLGVPDTSGLTSVGTYFMGSYAYGCSSLTSLGVPDTSGLTSVGNYFMGSYAVGCSGLTSLGVPDTSGLASVGNGFMSSYAGNCNALTELHLPSSTGWFAINNINWGIPAGRLGILKGHVQDAASKAAWDLLTVSGKTLYTNQIQSTANVIIVGGEPQPEEYSLECAKGTYALTGNSATFSLVRNYRLTANAGTYSLTGSNAELTRGFTLKASGDGITISGAGSAVVNGEYTLIAPKQYEKTDADVYVLYTLLLGGIWSIGDEFNSYYNAESNVETPDLVTNWEVQEGGALPLPTVTASSGGGSYKITGADANLTIQRNYVLACASGSYSVSGNDVTFAIQRNYVLQLDSGAYILTGTNVNFIVGTTTTPMCRTFVIEPENRTYVIEPENRTYEVRC